MKKCYWFFLIAFFVLFPSLAQETQVPENVQAVIETTTINDTSKAELIPNQGFSINSLWRGMLGMVVLILISFLFSANRKAINWKTVGIGLSIQLLIAIVLSVPLTLSLMNQWLENFAYRTSLSWWIFGIAGLIALVVTLLTVSSQTLKAAGRNPADVLRYE